MVNVLARENVSARNADQRLRRILQGADYGNGYSTQNETLENRLRVFDDFLRFGGFESIYHLVAQDCQRLMKAEDIKSLENRFVGRVFECIGYFFMLNRSLGLVTSPQETLDFYRWLYPKPQLRRSALGFDSIRGVNMPDGLLIEEQHGLYKVVEVCEYTTVRDTEYFEYKFRGFKRIKKDFPAVFDEAQLLFLVPKWLDPPLINDYYIAFDFTPFSKKELINFALRLLEREGPQGQRSIKSLFESYKGKHTVKSYDVNGISSIDGHP